MKKSLVFLLAGIFLLSGCSKGISETCTISEDGVTSVLDLYANEEGEVEELKNTSTINYTDSNITKSDAQKSFDYLEKIYEEEDDIEVSLKLGNEEATITIKIKGTTNVKDYYNRSSVVKAAFLEEMKQDIINNGGSCK